MNIGQWVVGTAPEFEKNDGGEKGGENEVCGWRVAARRRPVQSTRGMDGKIVGRRIWI